MKEAGGGVDQTSHRNPADAGPRAGGEEREGLSAPRAWAAATVTLSSRLTYASQRSRSAATVILCVYTSGISYTYVV